MRNEKKLRLKNKSNASMIRIAGVVRVRSHVPVRDSEGCGVQEEQVLK